MMLLIFTYGLIIGSFLNVCIYRIPREESIAWPGSHCPTCNHSLFWYDNIPVFSYLMLKGRCRYCKDSISARYPLVELLNAIIYLLVYFRLGFGVDFIFYSLILSLLVAVIFIDLKDMIIPDSLVLSVLVLSVIHKAVNYFLHGISPELIGSILGLLLAAGLFLAIVIVSGGGMGGGDVTLIELIVVIAILGILAAIAIPRFFNVQDQARQDADKTSAAAIANAVAIFNASNNKALDYTPTPKELVDANLISADAFVPQYQPTTNLGYNVVVTNGTAAVGYASTAVSGTSTAWGTLITGSSLY